MRPPRTYRAAAVRALEEAAVPVTKTAENKLQKKWWRYALAVFFSAMLNKRTQRKARVQPNSVTSPAKLQSRKSHTRPQYRAVESDRDHPQKEPDSMPLPKRPK